MLRFAEASPVQVLNSKPSEHLEIGELHFLGQKVIKTNSKPDIDCFNYLKSSRTLNNYRLLNHFPQVFRELEGVPSCDQTHL